MVMEGDSCFKGCGFEFLAYAISVTRLGYFWKVLQTNSLIKLAETFGNLLCYLRTLSFYVKTVLAPFWATLGEDWAPFFNVWSQITEIVVESIPLRALTKQNQTGFYLVMGAHKLTKVGCVMKLNISSLVLKSPFQVNVYIRISLCVNILRSLWFKYVYIWKQIMLAKLTAGPMVVTYASGWRKYKIITSCRK